MDAQLRLLPNNLPTDPPADGFPTGAATPASWHLDDDDRDVGRRGVARARAALRAGRRAAADGHPSAA